MSTQLQLFITNVLAMPHYANDAVGSGTKHDSHEDALASELQKVGFTEIFQQGTRHTRPSKKNPNGHKTKTKTFPKLGRDAVKRAIKSDNPQQELSKLVPGMPSGTFIRQPCNSKAFPDHPSALGTSRRFCCGLPGWLCSIGEFAGFSNEVSFAVQED